MPGDANVAAVAAALADPTRTAMLMALLDGRAVPAGELARRTRVSVSTASHHLARLLEHQLIAVEHQGRHRYIRLAGPAIAQLLEDLALVAPPMPVHSLRESEAGRALRAARMCYNHFAGHFGVVLARTLVEQDFLRVGEGGYLVTESGRKWFHEVGITSALLDKSGPIVVPHHIDWTERLYHVAGPIGAAIARRFVELEWVRRQPASRMVHLTPEGELALCRELGLHLSRDSRVAR